MTALDNFISVISSLDSEALRVAPERCVQVRHKGAHCLRCAEVCAAGAIAYDGEDVVIDGELCIGCGSCATACPTGALEAAHPTDAELSQALVERVEAGDTVIVACARALNRARRRAEERADAASGLLRRAPMDFDASHILQVVCLGRVDESFYVECAARGVDTVTLACDSCETCKYHRGGALARRAAESARNLLAAHGWKLETAFVSPLPKRAYAGRGAAGGFGYDPAKRATIATLREMTASAAKEAAADVLLPADASDGEAPAPRYVKVSESGTLPQFLPVRRNRVVNSLRRVGAPVEEEVTTRLWGRVSIDGDACTSCRMCATFCPTGAIQRFEEADGTIGIDHRSYRCVQCRLCEDICMTGALTVSDTVSLDDFEHGRVRRIPMAPPTWTPNKPDSIFTKMNQIIGGEHNSYF